MNDPSVISLGDPHDLQAIIEANNNPHQDIWLRWKCAECGNLTGAFNRTQSSRTGICWLCLTFGPERTITIPEVPWQWRGDTGIDGGGI